LSEIASFATPPQAIRDVLSGVIALLGNQDTSWNSMKAILKAKGIKDQIVNFDAKSITPEIREAANKIIEANANSFEEKVIFKVSKAAAPLAAWAKANVQYSSVLESISPLTTTLEKTKKSLESSEKKLKVSIKITRSLH
jgi:dynein heavy chain 2